MDQITHPSSHGYSHDPQENPQRRRCAYEEALSKQIDVPPRLFLAQEGDQLIGL